MRIANLKKICFAIAIIIGCTNVATAKSMMQDENFVTEISQHRSQLYNYLGSVTSETRADIAAIYPISEVPTERFFGRVIWKLAPTGAAVMWIPPEAALGARLLRGTWSACGASRCLHMKAQGVKGESLSLDGVFETQGNSVKLHGIWTVSIRNVSRVDLVQFTLRPLSSGELKLALADISKVHQQEAEDAPGDQRLHSDQAELIYGVPTFANFDVTLDITMDGVRLGQRTGKLVINSNKFKATPDTKDAANAVTSVSNPEFDITLGTLGDTELGRSMWMTRQPGGEKTPGVSVTAKGGGRLGVNIGHVDFASGIMWFARNPERPDSISNVAPESGAIELMVTPDTVEGTILATGEILDGNHPKSHFEARIWGTRAGKGVDECVAKSFGRRAFDGEWKTLLPGTPPRGGEKFALQQKQNKLGGLLPDYIEIDGAVKGRVANIVWRKGKKETGNGFLTLTDGGFLTGLMWGGNANNAPQPVIAELSGDVCTPRTDDEANALRWLGYDLANAGKHAQAVKILTLVVDHFQHQAEKAEKDPNASPNARNGYLIQQGIPLVTLTDAAFRIGDYQTLVKALRRTLEIRCALGQVSATPVLLREQVRAYRRILEETENTLQLQSGAFERARITATSGGIGIGFEPLGEAKGFRITEVRPGFPAAEARMAVGDVLSKVDGVTTTGMANEEIMRRLTGTPASTVTIEFQRNDAPPAAVRLTRKPLLHLDDAEKAALVEVLTTLRDLTVGEARIIHAEAVEIESCKSFDDLLQRISRRRAALAQLQRTVLELSDRGLSVAPVELALFRRFVNAMAAQNENAAELKKIDYEIDALKQDHGRNNFYTSLLELYGTTWGTLSVADVSLARRHNNATAMRKQADTADPPAKIAKSLHDLEGVLSRWRAHLTLDKAKIEAMGKEAGAGSSEFYSEYVRILAEFSLLEPSSANQLAEDALVASERARERALADLLASHMKEADGQNVPRAKPSDRSSKDLLSFHTADTLTIETLRELTRQTEGTILEYFLTENELYIWVVQPTTQRSNGSTSIYLRRVPIGERQIGAKVEQLLKLMEETSLHPVLDSKSAVSSLLRELYQDVIAPVENLLPKNPDSPVIIVPHKSLSFVPFAALIQSQENSDRRFVEDHAIIYAPSLSVLRLVRKSQSKTPLPTKPSLLAVINPEFGPDLRSLSNRPFSQLPQLEADAGFITDFYDNERTKVLAGKNATPDAVLANARSRDVLLFLTHAEADEKDSYRSYVALARGILRIREFGSERFDSRLVIFGACQTGRGSINGDGVMGLTRMTLAAGAQNVLVSLWKVPEEETMQLIYAFHKARKGGKPMVTAFHEAQIARLKVNRDQTLVWAGFILVGSDQCNDQAFVKQHSSQ